MLEVEKKFQPTTEQLNTLISDAEFLGEIVNHDIYYDYDDFRLLKDNIRLRNRNGLFELKIGKSSGVAHEIEDIEEIKKYFNVEDSLENFIENSLNIVMDFKTNRQKYKKQEFHIDIDKTSFGYNMCEIEIMVEKEEELKEAEDKIINLAAKHEFEVKRMNGKGKEYLRIFNPEIYKEIFEKI